MTQKSQEDEMDCRKGGLFCREERVEEESRGEEVNPAAVHLLQRAVARSSGCWENTGIMAV